MHIRPVQSVSVGGDACVPMAMRRVHTSKHSVVEIRKVASARAIHADTHQLTLSVADCLQGLGLLCITILAFAALIGACVAIAVAGMLYEGLKVGREALLFRHARAVNASKRKW